MELLVKKKNIKLINNLNASVMITKESGKIGGVTEKIQAANETSIDVIMIQRPKIKELNKKNIVSNLDELDKKIKSYF